MSTPEDRWWCLRAGEYVLGTLRGRDLELFERILAHDTTIQGEVARWERDLHALSETALEQPPAAHVWPTILERIREPEAGASEVTSPVASAVASARNADRAAGTVAGSRQANAAAPDAGAGARFDDEADIDADPETGARLAEASAVGAVGGASTDPDRSSSRRSRSGRSRSGRARSRQASTWRGLAGLATAASLVLAFLLFQRVESVAPTDLSTDGVAVVLSDEDGAPYFLIETDYDEGRVRVTALAPPTLEADRNFQLWQALPDRSAVRAVALLPEESGRSRVFEVTTLIEGSDLFGVSLEPVGAPTDGGPTGPVVAHGDFLETLPDD